MDLFNINDYSLANFEFTFEQFSTHDDTVSPLYGIHTTGPQA